MNLQQVRYVLEVARRGLNISEAAAAMHTSQPGVSKQIRVLEDELGVEIFIRQGKRLTGITAPGREVLLIAERMLHDVDNLKSVGAAYSNEASGSLSIATTHTQARYVLPPVLGRFMRAHPGVRVSLHQGNPTQVCEYVRSGEADIGIATETIVDQADIVTLPCYQWNRSLVVPPRHPLLKASPLTLAEIARYPIITYDSAFTGRSQVNRAFAARGISPNVVLSATDADIIKTYVALGLGVGLIASMAFDPDTDKGLRAIDAAHLFESATTHIGIMRNAYLRGYAYAFIEMFAPQLTRRAVEAVLSGEEGSDAGL